MTDHRPPLRIRSIGYYLPERRDSNREHAARIGFDQEFLENKLGVLQRSVMETGETSGDLAVRAFKALAGEGVVSADEIELLVVVTQHPDFKVPHTAAIVHNRLGLAKHCMTFDISQGCAGYTHALAVIFGVMDNAGLEHGVLITSDPYSDKILSDDRDVSLLFGDAATATYFSRRGPGYHLIDSNFATLPESYRCLMYRDHLEMDGGAVFKHAVREVPPSIKDLLQRHRLEISDIDLFLLHQGSKYLVEYIGRKLAISPAKNPFEATDYGNTVSSSIPLMLKKHIDAGELERIVLSGFGVGFTLGNNLLQRII